MPNCHANSMLIRWISYDRPGCNSDSLVDDRIMNSKTNHVFLLGVAILLAPRAASVADAVEDAGDSSQPNLVVIFVDDMGFADPSCLWQPRDENPEHRPSRGSWYSVHQLLCQLAHLFGLTRRVDHGTLPTTIPDPFLPCFSRFKPAAKDAGLARCGSADTGKEPSINRIQNRPLRQVAHGRRT